MYIPDVVCPNCSKKQKYNLNGTSYWGKTVCKCCICGHKWEVNMEEFRCNKPRSLEDFTTRELEAELERRKRREPTPEEIEYEDQLDKRIRAIFERERERRRKVRNN